MTATASAPATDRLPGPPRIPIVGWRARALRMLRDPAGYFMTLYGRYGPISAWDSRTPRHVFVFGPDYHRLLFTQPDTFIVDAFRELRMPPGSSLERLSAGLLRLNGSKHRQHRRLMQPAFTARRVRVHENAIVELTQTELDRWQIGEQRRVDLDLSRLITLIAIRTMFGVEAHESVQRLHRLVIRLLAVASAPTTLAFPFDLPGTTYRKALRTAEAIEHMLRELVRERRPYASQRQDVLSALIVARDSDDSNLSDDELISEAYTTFCHESSAAALTWTLFLLDQHPDVLQELVHELRSTLGGEPPTAEQLDRLDLLDRVVKESLRLLPPASFALRYTAQPCALGPYELPEGATIFYSSYVTHRIPEIFPDPLRFDPDRWETISPSLYEYIPFGAGPHHCLGRHFALLEIKIILAMLLQRYRLTVVPGTRIDRAIRISLVPRRGMPMVIHPAGRQVRTGEVTGNIRESVAFR